MQFDSVTARAEMADLAPPVPPSAAPPSNEHGLTEELRGQIGAIHDDPDFMTSLARGLLVLSVFARHPRGVTMALASKETGISRAAVRRVLYTLSRLGYVGERNRGYVLLPRVLGIGATYLSTSAMTVAAQPVLDALRDRIDESCSLGVLDGDDVLCLVHARTPRMLPTGPRPGSRLPAYCTSMGRVLLAALPHDSLHGYLQRTALRARTERTVTAPAEFDQRLNHARHEDMALVDQELLPGLRSIAVPVRNRNGTVVAALDIAADSGRVNPQTMQSGLLPALREAARHLGTLLD